MGLSQGAKFRLAVKQNHPLQIVGTVNPYCAMMAKKRRSSSYLSVGWGYRQCLLRFA